MNIKTTSIIAAILTLSCIAGIASANVSSERIYFSEETAIPFEIFLLIFSVGIAFLILSVITGFSSNAGLTMIFGLVSSLFLTSSAYAAPVTGFYSYASNTTTNATSLATPVIWLVFQPWMSWLCWGLATIALIMFIFGVLILFTERAHEEDVDWV